MNADINISFMPDSDTEKAKITIRSFGGIHELRWQGKCLSAIASMDPGDIYRLCECIKLAESKRIDPDKKFIEAMEYVISRLHAFGDDQSNLWVSCELEMPIASCGSIKLEPNFDRPLKNPDEEK